MENENLNNQEVNNEPRKKVKKALAITGLAIFILVAGYFGIQHQDLLRAELTSGGGSASSQLYVRDDYTGEPGETDTIVVRNGQTLTDLIDLDIRLSAPLSQLLWVDVDLGSGPLQNEAFTIDNNLDGTFDINFTAFAPIASIGPNSNLFEVRVILDSDLVNNDTVLITYVDANSTLEFNSGGGPVGIATFTDGKITIATSSACELLNCGDYGACNPTTELCECNRGYFGLECNQCDIDGGYTGPFPSCTLSEFTNLNDMILSLDQVTINGLTDEARAEAFDSATILINSPNALGHTITLEGETIPINVPFVDNTSLVGYWNVRRWVEVGHAGAR